MDKTRSPSVFGLLITIVVVIVALIYGFISLNTEDPLWFVASFDEQPEEIFINCYGEEVVLVPEDPQFDGLVTIVNNILSRRKNWDSLTISEETYEDYQRNTQMMIMELYYSQQVRIHSFYKYFSNLDSIIIPLDGRHAKTNAIFGRSNNFNTAGSLHFDDIPAIREHVENQGICITP
ncbi:MAG: hypothetical protein ACE5GO_01070 [Anaerolineales bacterium]